jgi:hypothetical protein
VLFERALVCSAGARNDDAGDAFERVAVRRVAGCVPGASREEVANSFEGAPVSNDAI